jgi:hypothetical protein
VSAEDSENSSDDMTINGGKINAIRFIVFPLYVSCYLYKHTLGYAELQRDDTRAKLLMREFQHTLAIISPRNNNFVNLYIIYAVIDLHSQVVHNPPCAAIFQGRPPPT